MTAALTTGEHLPRTHTHRANTQRPMPRWSRSLPCSFNAEAQEIGDAANTGVSLHIEAITGQIPFNGNHDDEITQVVPVAPLMRRRMPPAQFGDLQQPDLIVAAPWQSALDGKPNDSKIAGPAEFSMRSRSCHDRRAHGSGHDLRLQTLAISSLAVATARPISSGFNSDVKKKRRRPAFNGTPG